MAVQGSRQSPLLLLSFHLVAISILSLSCNRAIEITKPLLPSRAPSTNVFDEYRSLEITPADGFDFPVGNPEGKGSYKDQTGGATYNGWFVETQFGEKYSLGIHPGEDWNGGGGGNTDFGQDVYSIANGRVKEAGNFGQPWGNVAIIEHVFYSNHEKRTIYSLYAHLAKISVEIGQIIKRRQNIGNIGRDPDETFSAHLHLELRWNGDLPPTYWPSSNGKDDTWLRENYAAPSDFIRENRKLPVPQNEKTLVLVDQESYKMRLYRENSLAGEYDISLGQGKGSKRIMGDNKTPKGMYFVVGKHRGSFEGSYGKYYGGHWIKINYPNKYDALRGQVDGLITEQQKVQISSSWYARKPTLENTELGGGIGFHGWIDEWDNSGPRHLSWGCVVMHIYDITKVYPEISEGSMVVIF